MSRANTAAETIRQCPVASERTRTAVIGGGPASGKTGILVERLVDLMTSPGGAASRGRGQTTMTHGAAPAVAPDRLAVLTGSPETARLLATRLRSAIAAELASESVADRRRQLVAIEAGLDGALIAGGDEVAPALLARIGRPGVDLLDLLDRDADARFALARAFDHIAVDDVDRAGDQRAIDRVDIAAMVMDPADITIAGEAAHQFETGGESLVVSLGDRGRPAALLGAAGASQLVADLTARVRGGLDWGEVAVIAGARGDVGQLIAELDAAGAPVADRTGSLMRIPAIRQIALALSAIADPRDAAASAALLSPPLFAIAPADRWAARAGSAAPVARARVAQAEAVVAGLRHRRADRTAGETVRALIRDSGCARSLAIGATGAVWLARLAAFCEAVDRLADRGADFDAVAAIARGWVDDPPPVDCPAPVGRSSLWLGDAVDLRGAPDVIYAWRCSDAELDRARRRAATAVICFPAGSAEPAPPRAPELARDPAVLVDGQPLADAVARAWERIEPEVSDPRLAPVSLVGFARRRSDTDDEPVRFDAAFEDTVRRAVQLSLGRGTAPASAVTSAALDTGLEAYLGEATEDVEHALDALARLGIDRAAVRFAYPIAGVGPGGELITGAVDIVGAAESEMWLIDLVSAAPPADRADIPVDRIDRLRIAAALIQRAQSFPLAARCGLLYTATGEVVSVTRSGGPRRGSRSGAGTRRPAFR